MKRALSRAFLVCAAFAVTGCSNSNSEPAANPSAAKESRSADAKPVNQYCVFMTDHEASPKHVRQHKGQTVGFCCANCLPEWDKLTDAQKDETLKSALAKK